jgi:hypothetical protein
MRRAGYTKRLTKLSAVSATSRQPLSTTSACPRFGSSTISVTASFSPSCSSSPVDRISQSRSPEATPLRISCREPPTAERAAALRGHGAFGRAAARDPDRNHRLASVRRGRRPAICPHEPPRERAGEARASRRRGARLLRARLQGARRRWDVVRRSIARGRGPRRAADRHRRGDRRRRLPAGARRPTARERSRADRRRRRGRAAAARESSGRARRHPRGPAGGRGRG